MKSTGNNAVIIVDDNPRDLSFLAELAETAGANPIILCESVAQGLEALKEGRPALLITDLNLGDGYGSELVELVAVLYEGLPVILVSGGLAAIDRLMLEQTLPGEVRVFNKIFREDILEAVSEALGSYQL